MFKDHFSGAARGYARFRPRYPDSLFRWLAEISPSRDRAWDAATGTGQAALGLAPYFAEVIATDASLEQIRQASVHPMVRYEVAPSEYAPIENSTVDLVTVAQALHWFDFDAFFGEVRRVARPGAVFAAASYGLARIGPAVDDLIDEFYRGPLDGFWPPERAYVDDRYRTIPFPFDEIEAPDFVMTARWTLDHLLGYLGTWSAVSRARQQTGIDPLAAIQPALESIWGEPLEFRQIFWPLSLRVGRI
jgi:SAM-dependent methyltransferase